MARTVYWTWVPGGARAESAGKSSERYAPARYFWPLHFTNSTCVSAIIMAPYFVHIDNIFRLGYNPKLNKEVQDGIKLELAKLDREEAAAAAKKL